MNLGRESGQRACYLQHASKQIFGMPKLRFKQMPQNWQMRIDRVQQPEVGDIGGIKISKRLVFLPALAAEFGAACDQNLDQAPQNADQIFAAVQINHGSDKRRSQLESASRRFLHARDSQSAAPLAVLIAHQQTQVLARQLNGPLHCPGIFVAQDFHFHAVTRGRVTSLGHRLRTPAGTGDGDGSHVGLVVGRASLSFG